MGIYQTDQTECWSAAGEPVPCAGSGQDAESKAGLDWPDPRFKRQGEVMVDRISGLAWPRDAGVSRFPLSWQEALDFAREMHQKKAFGQALSWTDALALIRRMNREKIFGRSNWRLPNIRELESLVDDQSHSPAVHPKARFEEVANFYWSSTTSVWDPSYAWTL